MTNKIKKLLIITSGGDAPGMNAGIRAVLRTAIANGIEVYGCEGGYKGLIEQNVFPLTSRDVANSIQRGGTILKTDRCEAFLQKPVRDKCREYLQALGIDAMVVLGGDGSFRGAFMLEQEGGPKTMGIPCTIDNDIVGTEYTIGFDTACNTALQAIDKIRDTAFSLNRHFLVEVMGRAAGFLAVEVGIAGGAEFILIPEVPISVEDLVQRIQSRPRRKLASIIVVAEAETTGRSFAIAEKIKQLSDISYKVCVLGHIQRGGEPTVKDRKMASLMGYHAVEHLLRGDTQKMIAVSKDQLIPVAFPDPAKGARRFDEKRFDEEVELMKINQIICGM
ncbi:MAG TPA: 6-phosphofructokinase [Gammaproteobacteria bacterium]|nr:6-phosphofructokinase [Gammaproteobacteria bacterium]